VILPTPFYFNHEMAVNIAGCKVVLVPTDRGYQLDLNAIREAIKPWAERLRDRRFETEGEWKNKLAGGTRGTVEALTRELREALRG